MIEELFFSFRSQGIISLNPCNEKEIGLETELCSVFRQKYVLHAIDFLAKNNKIRYHSSKD